MDVDDIQDEIARIEAELNMSSAQQQQQQQQQQPQAQQPQAQQGSQFTFSASSAPFTPQQPQAPPPQHGGPAAATVHRFSKDSDSRSVYVEGLPKAGEGEPVTREELAAFFADCGQVLNCTLLADRATGEPKGTAYIEFATLTAMGAAVEGKTGAEFRGRPLTVSQKRSKFRPAAARGRGRGGRGGAPDPYQVIAALMGVAPSAYAAGRGRGGGGRGRGRGRGGRGGGGGVLDGNAGAPGGFKPF